jgi:hypothetical protein
VNYLTSTRHLMGVGLALLGLAAHFLGWLGAWWLPIVAGLYLAGVLLTPARTRLDLQLARESSIDELSAELNRFVRGLRGKVPAELLTRTQGIAGQLEAILPRLGTLEAQGDPNAFTVRLGKSPDALVAEQLDLLSSTLERVSSDTVKGDADALAANGRFLKDKFGKPDLEL